MISVCGCVAPVVVSYFVVTHLSSPIVKTKICRPSSLHCLMN
jgi:hypothetical protein